MLCYVTLQQRLTSGVQPSVQQWTVGSSVTHLRNYLSQLDVPFEDIQRYLVYRIPGTAEPPVPQSSSAPVQDSLVHAERVEATAVPEVKGKKNVFTTDSVCDPTHCRSNKTELTHSNICYYHFVFSQNIVIKYSKTSSEPILVLTILPLSSQWKQMALHLNVIELLCHFRIRMFKIKVWQWTLTLSLMCCWVLKHGTPPCLL